MKPEDNPITNQGFVNPSADPQTPSTNPVSGDLAAEVIRKKIEKLYDKEPNAKEEIVKAEGASHRSRHQQFMHELTNSGKSLVEIQTAWHQYYVNLPDNEKHAVWQEFYTAHENTKHTAHTTPQATPQTPTVHSSPKRVTSAAKQKIKRVTSSRTVSEIKKQLNDTVNTRGKLQTKHHVQSVLFGLGIGSLVMVVLLFGFFNERFIAPFVTPSKAVSNTPIIVDPNNTAAGPDQKIIIPKINVEIPVVYDQPSIEEKAIQDSLERGVVHYATTPSPGEQGNVAIVGHSSNNILNKGQYKFAFVLLSRLEAGDTFMLTKNNTRYVYRVYEKRIVKPNEVGVLGTQAKPATATLITCDPPGTAVNRLVVVGEQISPDPASNGASTALPDTQQPAEIAGNAPSLWSRFTGWLRD